MKRDTAALADARFDVLVVGGGIVGACVAWDAALRGLSVALVDRGDFAAGTSANSLKIIHGGLRYLQHLDFRRMRESIGERSTWLRIAPHLVEPLPFLVPARRNGKQRLGLLRAALAVNDAVAWDRNRHLLPERQLPGGRAVSRDECASLVRALAGDRGITGGVIFFDAQVYSAERLVLEAVRAANDAGAVIANYVDVEGPLVHDGERVGVRALDRVSGDRFDIRARFLVNAAGPATGPLCARLLGRPSEASPAYSVALNLVVPELGPSVAVTVSGPDADVNSRIHVGNRQLLIVPWRNRSLVGTAHYSYAGDPSRFTLDESLVARFLEEVNHAWPGRPIRPADVKLVHSGLLPIAGELAETVRLHKRHMVIDHATDGDARMISVVGVKLTTSRLAAEEAVNRLFWKLGKGVPPCRTSSTPLPGSPLGSIAELVVEGQRTYGEVLPSAVVEHLARSYGASCGRVLAIANAEPGGAVRVVPGDAVIAAQFRYAIEEEMAQFPEDLIQRRTELGPRGMATPGAWEAAARAFTAAGRTVPDQAAIVPQSKS